MKPYVLILASILSPEHCDDGINPPTPIVYAQAVDESEPMPWGNLGKLYKCDLLRVSSIGVDYDNPPSSWTLLTSEFQSISSFPTEPIKIRLDSDASCKLPDGTVKTLPEGTVVTVPGDVPEWLTNTIPVLVAP